MIVSFIRHGSTLWNEQGRMQGRRDIPLSERGRAQVRSWQLPLEHGPVVRYSSPLSRALETAEILFGGTPPSEAALVEMNWGDWEGMSLDELRERHGDLFARCEARGLDFRPPGGESPRDVLGRLRPWFARAAASPVPILAITHLGVLRAVLAAATGWDMTGKPPVRLAANALHRFALDDAAKISIVECNVSLVAP